MIKTFTRLFYLMLLCSLSTSLSFSQVAILESLDSGVPSSFTSSGATFYTITSTSTPPAICEGSGFIRANVYSSNPTVSLESPDFTSNGDDITYSFQYATRPYSSGSVGGTLDVQYSIDNGSTWVDVTNSPVTLSATLPCTSFSETIPGASVPSGSSFRIKITTTRTASDWYIHLDDLSVTQPSTAPPLCATITSPSDGATDVDADDDLNWNTTYGATTYFLTVGTTSGGNDILDNVDVGNVTTYDLGTMAYNTTYYVTLTPSNSYGTASSCMETSFTTQVQPPANNDCANATTIMESTVSTCDNAVSGTTNSATHSSDYSCSSSYVEVWYSFTPLTTGTYDFSRTLTSGSASTYISIWTGSCGSLSKINSSCYSSSISAQALTAGTTYLVSIASTSGVDFDLCIAPTPPPPANDDCSNAIPLTLSTDANCNNAISGTTTSATHSSNYSCSTSYEDVWYSFTPTTTTAYNFSVTRTLGTSSTYTSVYSGSCGSLTRLNSSCYSTAIDGLTLTAGTTYLVSVATYSGNNNFDLCVYESPAAPVNNDCSTPTTITLSPDNTCANAVSGTLVSATPSTEFSCSSSYNSVWYAFTPATTAGYIFDRTVLTGSTSTFINVWNGTCSSLTRITSGSCYSSTPSQVMLTAGTTYLVSVSMYYNNTPSTFDLCVYEAPPPPSNSVCTAPEPLWTAGAATSNNGATFNGQYATPSGIADPSCGSGFEDDLWFSIEAVVPGESFTVSATGDASYDPVLTLYSGDCSGLIQLECKDASGSGNTETITYTVPTPRGVSATTTYLVRVNDYSSSGSTTFTITASGLALPVELVNFSAKSAGDVNILSWATASELNSSDFSIERSRDGQKYEAIGSVQAKGKSTLTSNYSFTDENPIQEAYYRLKMNDIDGKSEYSNVVFVGRDGSDAMKMLSVYPVPTNDKLSIRVAANTSEEVPVQIIDLSGKVIYLETINLVEGTFDYELDLSGLDNGSYIGRMNDQVFKVVVQK